jgi:hypothetical protein
MGSREVTLASGGPSGNDGLGRITVCVFIRLQADVHLIRGYLQLLSSVRECRRDERLFEAKDTQ